jgi:hypothetical protein
VAAGIILCSLFVPVKASENNSEWLTRKRLIDPKLKAAGWRIVPFDPGEPLYEKSHTADGNISGPVRAYEYLRLSSLAMHLLDGGLIR